MIEGFKFSVTTAEAVEHFKARAEYHEARAFALEGQMGSLAEAKRVLGVATEAARKSLMDTVSNYRNDIGGYAADPLEVLKGKISDRKRRALKFRFLTDHVPKGEVFSVSGGDLAEYEFGLAATDSGDENE